MDLTSRSSTDRGRGTSHNSTLVTKYFTIDTLWFPFNSVEGYNIKGSILSYVNIKFLRIYFVEIVKFS